MPKAKIFMEHLNFLMTLVTHSLFVIPSHTLHTNTLSLRLTTYPYI